MFTRAALALTLALAPLAASAQDRPAAGDDYVRPPAKEGHSYPECYCTDTRGRRIEVGETACLRIGDREVRSRCTKRRNLVIWRHIEQGCAPGV